MTKPELIGVSGSLRPGSCSLKLLNLAFNELEKLGHKGKYLDIQNLNLPFCDGRLEAYPKYPDVKLLRKDFLQAKGIILVTPEYHGSISGVLKNALDLLDSEQFSGKVFALISVMGGIPSTLALETMRTICRQLNSWVLPKQLVVSSSYSAFDSEGNLKDVKARERLREMMEHFVQAVDSLH